MRRQIRIVMLLGVLLISAPAAMAGETTAPIPPVKPIPPMKPIPEMQPVPGVHPIPHVKPIPDHHKKKPKPIRRAGRRRQHTSRCHSTDTCKAPPGATCECHCEGSHAVCKFNYGGSGGPH